MKKINRSQKLNVTTETVRSLSTEELNVVGGASGSPMCVNRFVSVSCVCPSFGTCAN